MERWGFLPPQPPIREQPRKGLSSIGLKLGGSEGSYILKETCKLMQVLILFYLPCSTDIFMSHFISILAACIFYKTNLVFVQVVQNSFNQMVL